MDSIQVNANFSVNLGSIDIRSMPVDTVAFYLSISQTENLDNQIKTNLETIRAKQAAVSETRQLVITMKEIQNQAKNGKLTEIPKDLQSALSANGISYTQNPEIATKQNELKGLNGEMTALNSDMQDMQALKTALQDLKQNGMERISTGNRVILGRRPELMLKLEKYGVMPPTCGGGPYDRFAKQQAATRTPPYNQQVYIDMANRLPSGWEELSGAEMDKVIGDLQTKMNEKQGVINSKQSQIDTKKGEVADLIVSDMDLTIEKVNNSIKDQNSAIELDMLNIQSLMSKRNQALEMSSNIMKKSTESKDSLIRNI